MVQRKKEVSIEIKTNAEHIHKIMDYKTYGVA
jgi:hypothetical protein